MEEVKIKKMTGRPKGAKSRDCQYYAELAKELKEYLDTLPNNGNDPGFYSIPKVQLIDLVEKTNEKFNLSNCKSNDRKVADKFIEFFDLKNDFIERYYRFLKKISIESNPEWPFKFTALMALMNI